jgi:hypothetical protein
MLLNGMLFLSFPASQEKQTKTNHTMTATLEETHLARLETTRGEAQIEPFARFNYMSDSNQSLLSISPTSQNETRNLLSKPSIWPPTLL